jgi:hypothetical protein
VIVSVIPALHVHPPRHMAPQMSSIAMAVLCQNIILVLGHKHHLPEQIVNRVEMLLSEYLNTTTSSAISITNAPPPATTLTLTDPTHFTIQHHWSICPHEEPEKFAARFSKICRKMLCLGWNLMTPAQGRLSDQGSTPSKLACGGRCLRRMTSVSR